MFASNQQVGMFNNYNPEEFLNWLTEEEISVPGPNHVEISTSDNAIRKFDNNEYNLIQQQKYEPIQCQEVSNNIYDPSAITQNLEEPTSSNRSLQPSSYYNIQSGNRLDQTYYSAQWHYARNNISSVQTYEKSKKNYKINHRGNIIIEPTTSSGYKAIVKRKRKRTMFTMEQIEVLEQIFSKKPYISRDDRQCIVNQLNLSDKSVKIWFQNRRLKVKRQDNEANDDFTEENMEALNDTLDYVESAIQKNTDEFGYVTLNDRIMNDLVNIIDTCLTRKIDVEASSSSDVTENSDCSMYEPISPASSEYSVEHANVSDWEAFEPSESLQRLLDIQSLIQL